MRCQHEDIGVAGTLSCFQRVGVLAISALIQGRMSGWGFRRGKALRADGREREQGREREKERERAIKT